MFPIESQIQLVSPLDANNDGLSDLIVPNPRKSELTLLLNQTGHEGANPEGNRQVLKNVNDGVNRLPPDARFKTKSKDTNSKPDLKKIFFGPRRELLLCSALRTSVQQQYSSVITA